MIIYTYKHLQYSNEYRFKTFNLCYYTNLRAVYTRIRNFLNHFNHSRIYFLLYSLMLNSVYVYK